MPTQHALTRLLPRFCSGRIANFYKSGRPKFRIPAMLCSWGRSFVVSSVTSLEVWRSALSYCKGRRRDSLKIIHVHIYIRLPYLSTRMPTYICIDACTCRRTNGNPAAVAAPTCILTHHVCVDRCKCLCTYVAGVSYTHPYAHTYSFSFVHVVAN